MATVTPQGQEILPYEGADIQRVRVYLPLLLDVRSFLLCLVLRDTRFPPTAHAIFIAEDAVQEISEAARIIEIP